MKTKILMAPRRSSRLVARELSQLTAELGHVPDKAEASKRLEKNFIQQPSSRQWRRMQARILRASGGAA